jgi:hypothetical protein
MLFEYAVDPKIVGSSWQNFRYLIEKFGFDRGRLISQFPKTWFAEAYKASESMKTIERKKFEEMLKQAKRAKVIRSGRPYDPTLGDWLSNAVAQQENSPFHAIISNKNPHGHPQILIADDIDESHPLMTSPHTWGVARVATSLAIAMRPLLTAATKVLFVDPFFDISRPQYQDTLKACLDIIRSSRATEVICEIHFCDHDKRPPAEILEREVRKWVPNILPQDMSITLFSWRERAGGEDFHARYLLTDLGGMNIEAGFQAVGEHQTVQLGLLPSDFVRSKLEAFERSASVYELVGPVLKVNFDGTVQHM